MRKKARRNHEQFPNTTFKVVICWVPSAGQTNCTQPQASLYTAVRDWKELITCIERNGGLKELYSLNATFKYTLEKDEFDDDHIGLYTHGQQMNDPYISRFRSTFSFQMR